jgi:tetratricopeptide (TPR) repeat protein
MTDRFTESQMTPEAWRRVKTITGDALECPECERDALIASACSGDRRLERQVRSLLRASIKAVDHFEMPPDLSQSTLTAGARIGNWRVIRQLGAGGMGIVYLAERVDGGFEQRAAIKLARGGIADAWLLQRFREERQILASLEHPQIARLIDGGSTADQIPYVAIEYVEGQPIDVYCHDRNLDLRGRLELFRQVCGAVHYAHQRLVVHRDIKPSNILVAEDGTPKLLDFGIAKLIDPMRARALTETRTLLRMGTPESVSPEQLQGKPITVAADIYALGVLLYRLLTGVSPYERHLGNETPPLIRAICEEDPELPGTVVRRGADANGPVRDAIPPDLDLIVMKALRKEPERRYGSAEQLADDIQRFLRGLPVHAAPDSWRYRTGKFVRRHAVAAIAAGVAVMAIVAGAGVAVYQARIAAEQRARAEQRLAEVRRMANSFIFEFHDAIADLPGSLAARQLVVKRAAGHLDILAHDAEGDMALQRELATANMRLGEILGGGGMANLGNLDAAAVRYQSARDALEALVSRVEPALQDIESLAILRVHLSRFEALRGDLAAAEKHAQEGVALLESRRPGRDGSALDPVPLARALQQLGFVQARRGDNSGARQSLSRAHVYATSRGEPDPPDAQHDSRVARIQADLAEQLILGGDVAAAFGLLRDSHRRLERLLALQPLNKRLRMNMVVTQNMLGMAARRTGKLDEAVDSFAAASAISEEMVAEEPSDQGARFAALHSHHGLGASLLSAGSTVAGIKALREAIIDGQKFLERTPTNDAARYEVASLQVELGEALIARDDLREGCGELRAGIETLRELAGRNRLPGEDMHREHQIERLLPRCAR